MCSFKWSEVEGESYHPEERHDMTEPPHTKLKYTIVEHNSYRVESRQFPEKNEYQYAVQLYSATINCK